MHAPGSGPTHDVVGPPSIPGGAPPPSDLPGPAEGSEPAAPAADGSHEPPTAEAAPTEHPAATVDAYAPDEAAASSAPAAGSRPSRGHRSVLWVSVGLVTVLAAGVLFLSGYSLGRQAATTPGTPAGEAQLFQPFWDAYRAVTERFAGEPVGRQQLVEGAIRGMIAALDDPYSMYLSPSDLRASLEGVNAQFEGVGAQIATETASGEPSSCTTLGPDCRLYVVSPIDGSPAIRAGIRAGDVIATVDGAPLDGLTVDAARDRIRGPVGTTVTLGIVRGGTTLSIAVVRQVITEQVVSGRDLAGGTVGYIRLTNFTTDAPKLFRTLLQADLKKGERKLIVDVRGDPGGFVDTARAIASEFIASGPVFYQQDSSGTRIAADATGDGLATDPSVRLVVLVDGGSASAAEIFAGAIQDRGRGLLVGEQTFGKGTMQEWDQLGNDMGGFRLTVARWLTPNGRWINEKGLTPDVVVPPATDPQTDAPLTKALELLGASALAPAA